MKDLLFVTLLGALAALLMVLVEGWTAPAVEARRRERLEAYLPDFAEQPLGDGITLLKTPSGNGDGILASGRGLWGPMDLLIILDDQSSSVGRLVVLAHQETPGLGSRIAEEEYLQRYEGLSLDRISPDAELPVDALSGATKSSQALAGAVRDALWGWQVAAGRTSRGDR